jgi:hypothetical protein
MKLYKFLAMDPEPMPEWLANFSKGGEFCRADFFSGRTAYYPGAGFDGHMVKVLNKAHATHVFIHVDYGVSQREILKQLTSNPHAVHGYSVLDVVEVDLKDLAPHDWHDLPWMGPNEPVRSMIVQGRMKPWHHLMHPFAMMAVFERVPEKGPEHGAERIAVLFIGADGAATYQALYGLRDGTPPPYLVLIQDHGFGGNYSPFAKDGMLHRYAQLINVFPKYLLVAWNSKPWDGYKRTFDAQPDYERQPNHDRQLYEFKGS